MANKCAICGADINVFQAQKLEDGNYICRKTCRAKGLKAFDYVHGSLPQVKAHIAQVERGTKLWNHYFVPKLKEKDKDKKLKVLPGNLYVAADIGLMAFVQNDYKFLMFGKTTRACVYRIADLYEYRYEEEKVKNGENIETKRFVRLYFINTDGLFDLKISIGNTGSYDTIAKYFDKLFGIQKTIGNAKNVIKNQANAVKDVASGFKSVLSGNENMTEKAAAAAASIDKAVYGDRTELIQKADAALSAFRE